MNLSGLIFATLYLAEIPLSSTYSNGNPWLGWSGRWLDWPLMVDRSLAYREGYYNQAVKDDFARTLGDIADYGCFDGFTYNADRKHFYQYFKEGLKDLPVKMAPNYQFVNGLEDEPFFGQVLASPYGLKRDGKMVITSYYTTRHTPEELKQKLDWLKGKYGDTFLFIASVVPFSVRKWNDFLLKDGSVPADEVEQVKEKLRAYLRVADGLSCEVYNHCAMNPVDGERSLDVGLFRSLVRLYKDVVSEPEFGGKKLLTVNVGLGHANPHTFGNRNSSNGTRTLRGSIETALSVNPDFLLFFEWDEWNENTCIKPTLWNSFSSKRIIRAERAIHEGRAAEPVRGDAPSVPNLILSFRKTLVLGEIARYEVLSVPDAGTKGAYEVSLVLKDEDGNVVKNFAPQMLDATRLVDCRFDFPSETVGNACALVPELTVRWNGTTFVYDNGLPFAEVRPTTTWDRKWVMMPLRDLAKDAVCELRNLGPAEDGKQRVEVAATLPAGIDRLEVLDGGEIVYSKPGDEKEDFRDDPEHYVFSCWNVLGRYSKRDAKISVSGASEAEWLIGTKRTRGLSRKVIAQSLYTPDTYLRLRRDEAMKAKVKLEWPEGGVFEIPLDRVIANDIYAVNGPTNGLVFGVRRYYKQPYFMSPVGKASASARVDVNPDLPVSVIGAHAIAADGKIWRSKPVVVGRRGGRKAKVRVYSNTYKRPVEVEVDAERVPVIEYDVTGYRTGTAVKSGFGRAFDAALGGSTAIATQRSRGSSSFVHVCLIDEASRTLPCWAPQQVDLGHGTSALRFDGTGTYFSTPMAVIPQNAAFKLAFDFKPDGSGEGMEVFSGGSSTIWGHLARLAVTDGKLVGTYVSTYDYQDTVVRSACDVRPDAWNHVEVVADVGTLELILNGESSGKVKRTMPARYDSCCWFGGRKDALFKGLIRNVHITHDLGSSKL